MSLEVQDLKPISFIQTLHLDVSLPSSSLSPSTNLSLPLTRAPTTSLHPALQPQMVEHCDQLKTSLRIEPVIAPAI